MASVTIHENLVPTEEVVIRLTTEEAQELFDTLGAEDCSRNQELYDALQNEGFEHPEEN